MSEERWRQHIARAIERSNREAEASRRDKLSFGLVCAALGVLFVLLLWRLVEG